MAGLADVLEQALQLSDVERGELIERLLRSFEPGDRDEVDAGEWESTWAAELDQRINEIREGTVELVDGADARARVRAAISRAR